METLHRDKERVVQELKEDGPLSFRELQDRLYGCDHCGKVTKEEESQVGKAVHSLHLDGHVYHTVDRRVDIKS